MLLKPECLFSQCFSTLANVSKQQIFNIDKNSDTYFFWQKFGNLFLDKWFSQNRVDGGSISERGK